MQKIHVKASESAKSKPNQAQAEPNPTEINSNPDEIEPNQARSNQNHSKRKPEAKFQKPSRDQAELRKASQKAEPQAKPSHASQGALGADRVPEGAPS